MKIPMALLVNVLLKILKLLLKESMPIPKPFMILLEIVVFAVVPVPIPMVPLPGPRLFKDCSTQFMMLDDIVPEPTDIAYLPSAVRLIMLLVTLPFPNRKITLALPVIVKPLIDALSFIPIP